MPLYDPNFDDSHLVTLDPYSLPSWLEYNSCCSNYFLQAFPTDESIMEILSIEELPWKYNHHRLSFLPNLEM
jgi:hypothetical protein